MPGVEDAVHPRLPTARPLQLSLPQKRGHHTYESNRRLRRRWERSWRVCAQLPADAHHIRLRDWPRPTCIQRTQQRRRTRSRRCHEAIACEKIRRSQATNVHPPTCHWGKGAAIKPPPSRSFRFSQIDGSITCLCEPNVS